MTTLKISLISSSPIDEDLVTEFRSELPENVEVRALYDGKFSNMDGATTSLIITITGFVAAGFLGKFGEKGADSLINKISKFIRQKRKLSKDQRASFELISREADSENKLKADNVSEAVIEKVVEKYFEIIKTQKESNIYIVSEETIIIQPPEKLDDYLKKDRDDPHQEFTD